MEKKSIGAFMATLRKASGLTQRELAEKLAVSDKTVSRWERGEGVPDLALIPVIAEIFGVSCDELLRGERLRRDEMSTTVSEQKTEKQLRWRLQKAATRFRVQSLIAVGLALAGLLAAAICNFAFFRSTLGFFLGCIGYAAAIICEIAFVTVSLPAIRGDEFEGEPLNACRQAVFRQAAGVIGGVVILLGFTLPLILKGDAYDALTPLAWLVYGLAGGGVAALLCWVLFPLLEPFLLRRGVLSLSDEEQARHAAQQRIRMRVTGCTLLVMAATLAVQIIAYAVVNVVSIGGQTTDGITLLFLVVDAVMNAVSIGGQITDGITLLFLVVYLVELAAGVISPIERNEKNEK